MEFRSLQMIGEVVTGLLPEVVGQFDCVAGFNDEAMVAARLLALYLSLPVLQLSEQSVAAGNQQRLGGRLLVVQLVVSDSHHAIQLTEQVNRLTGSKSKVLGIYATADAESKLDLVGEVVPSPPYFEWNFLKRDGLDRVCFDIDGVLCEDPTERQNDDGPIYRAFLESARPLHLPMSTVGWLVTSRLERYRELTERWMAAHGVSFRELHMIDLPTKAARQAAKCHGKFKAEVYASVQAELFIESNPEQAWEIAELTGKPVFCVDQMKMVDLTRPIPQNLTPAKGPLARLSGRARRLMKRIMR